ncbi:MAG: 16S rRNA (cytidine(1402)-2'-O)-methyltransferase [Gammaproteobacteria bacterium]|nr:16S rRNA (cytidine(1402)-2'-O)-methyltransferase [Gammaproteobacteria bacterium]
MHSLTAALYIVATPIGNDGDMTPRALQVLAAADYLLAEDTRRYGLRAKQWGVPTKSIALHDHNEQDKAQQVMEWVEQGASVALVSDAGTPLISDPGYVLVEAFHQRGLKVVPVPGVSSVVTALSISGLPTHNFYFEGFLPSKGAARVARLSALRGLDSTLVFLESPRRIVELLEGLKQVFGGGEVALCRELTKTYETVLRGSVDHLIQAVSDDPQQQLGEMVVVFKPLPVGVDVGHWHSVLNDLAAEMPPRKAAKLVAKWSGLNARDLYALLV